MIGKTLRNVKAKVMTGISVGEQARTYDFTMDFATFFANREYELRE